MYYIIIIIVIIVIIIIIIIVGVAIPAAQVWSSGVVWLSGGVPVGPRVRLTRLHLVGLKRERWSQYSICYHILLLHSTVILYYIIS